ncbi:5-oxoprolinase subunit PxpA [Geminicoccaceae bacterium 1502E]|nr:5-oxoprolinase subunit PxpA [Geminicoccaceae bacterium 1502E]
MALAVDLNSDLGESFGAWTMGNDAEMLDIVTTANVACGFHAGDPLVMHETVRLALERGVEIGAHPGFLDLWGFGRRPIQGERPGDVEKLIIYQIGALQAMAAVVGHKVRHLKTHGALGNMAAVDADLAMAVARASKAVDPEMIFVVMPGNELEKAGEKLGLRMAREVYADRTYDDAGNLTSRKLPGAVIHDSAEATQRVLRMLEDGAITSASGKRIPVAIDTICVHGDNPAAVAMARGIREAMEEAGVTLRPFAQAL